MFRNLTIFRVEGLDAITEAGAQAFRFTPCRPTEDRSIGWTPPRGLEHGALVETVGEHTILTATIERKRVPGDALRRAVEHRCKVIEQQEGFKPGRARKKELKDELLAEMLVHAIPTRTAIRAWLDSKAGTLAIDSVGSACDDVVAMLVRSFDGLSLTHLTTVSEPQLAMGSWLMVDGDLDWFMVGRDADLASSGGASVRLRDRDLTSEHVVAMLTQQGMKVSRLEVHHETASFMLSPTLQLRRIRIELPDTPHNEVDDPFDADVTISCGTLRKVIDDLVHELGGLRPQEAQS